MVQNKSTDLSDSPEGLFIGEYGVEKYATSRANLGVNYGIRIVSLVVVMTFVIVFFELMPERAVWSIPVKQGEEHMIAAPGSGGFSVMLMQKQGAGEHTAATKEEYKKQYHVRKRILIVDDEPDITSSFKEALRDHGFEQVDISNDPLLALKNFKAGSYDLLIIDIVMPEMDGFGLYEEIRKIDNKVKVCFITAFEVNYQALRAVFPSATTADDIGCFIRKPVDIDDLVKRIKAEIQ
jgi:two-component system, OmpR family, response regulator ChvI